MYYSGILKNLNCSCKNEKLHSIYHKISRIIHTILIIITDLKPPGMQASTFDAYPKPG